MRKGFIIALLAVLFIVVGCAGSGVDTTLNLEPTSELAEYVEQEDVNEDADDINISGTWEYADDDDPGIILVIEPDHTFELYMYYITATGILSSIDQEPARWTSEATLLGTRGDPDYTEPLILSFSYEESTDGLTVTIQLVGEEYHSILFRRGDPSVRKPIYTITFVAYVHEDLSEADARAIEKELRAIPKVTGITFVSREEAMENFIGRYDKDYYDIIDLTWFRHRYIIYIDDVEHIPDIKQTLEQIPGIAEVSDSLGVER